MPKGWWQMQWLCQTVCTKVVKKPESTTAPHAAVEGG